jgi:hypothetical protein
MTEMQDDQTAEPGIDVFVQLAASLGSTARELETQNNDRRRNEQHWLRNQPRHVPLAANTILDANGNGQIDFGAPQDGRIWVVRQATVSQAGAENTPASDETDAATSPFAAGAAGSVSLPGVTFVTGFDVSISAGTLAGLSTVTLSNVVGGPFTWAVQQETGSGVQILERFPGNGIAVTPGATATLTINVTASGGSGTLTLYGTQTQSSAGANWYIGMAPAFNAGQAPVLLTSQWRHKQDVMPRIDNFSADFLTVRAREHLYVQLTGGASGNNIVCGAVIHDRPLYGRTPTVGE